MQSCSVGGVLRIIHTTIIRLKRWRTMPMNIEAALDILELRLEDCEEPQLIEAWIVAKKYIYERIHNVTDKETK